MHKINITINMNLNSFLYFGILYVFLWLPFISSSEAPHRKLLQQGAVQLRELDPYHVMIDNGIVQVTFSKPQGFIVGIGYNGIPNVLDHRQKENARGYWDVVWSRPGSGRNLFDKLEATAYKVITLNQDVVEISFTKQWNPSMGGSVIPLNIDKRYIVTRGKSGVYAYCIMERLKGWPDVKMDQIRIAIKLHPNLFDYMVVSDLIQRQMPTLEEHDSGQRLAYPEAVILRNTRNPYLQGEVDDKYQYAMEQKDSKVHGFITSSNPQVGFWMIRPSDEYSIGGPKRQDLTSHAGPTVLGMFTSTHFGGTDLDTEYRNGEPWKKVFGPNFLYLNSVPSNGEYMAFWANAKQQALAEAKQWPYGFVQSVDYPKAAMRGSVSGQVTVHDGGKSYWGQNAYVLLGRPGQIGSWKFDTKNYQFWTQADVNGNFLIRNVRPGYYDLYGWVPGFIGEFKYQTTISIVPGRQVNVGTIPFRPPRNGPTIWEIGVPDRMAAEFFVPNPIPSLKNNVFLNKPTETFRQYGLWERYAALYPRNDLVFTVGSSDYRRDWFFAHVPRRSGNGYLQTTWQIVFNLRNVQTSGDYTFQLAIAGSSSGSLQVRLNNPDPRKRPILATGTIGRDNAITRHGIHGIYWLYSVPVPANMLVAGRNTFYLSLGRSFYPFQGLMYDYLRLEAPPL